MNLTRREFLRGMAGWGGLLVAGSLELRAVRAAEPIRRAHRYLVARQSADGAWRSGRYAAFREGDVLTPVVLWAMQVEKRENGMEPVFARGLAWLRALTDRVALGSNSRATGDAGGHRAVGAGDTRLPGTDGAVPSSADSEIQSETRGKSGAQENAWAILRYPLFAASYAAQIFAHSGDHVRAAAWAKIIEVLRTREALGWPTGDPMCGAWSDASTPPQYVTPVPDMLAPNISATALAAAALRAAGGDPQSALSFIVRCQNFSDGEPTKFDDGGFFFALDDPIRNKAGRAGRDGRGRERFYSYGSATCDGYLALRACGLPSEHPRVQAAVEWLRGHSEGLSHGGTWLAGREAARASLAFYYGQALAAVLKDIPESTAWIRQLRAALSSELIARQSDEGSWQGLAPDSCEDEPLVASAFALRTLSLLA